MKKGRRILASVLCMLMTISYMPEMAFAASTSTSSGNIVISDKSYEIAPDITEREYITNNKDLTAQQMGHVMEVKLGENAQIIAGYNDYNIDAIKSGTNWGMRKVTEQAQDAETVRHVNVVGAVNGDFFDMSNGRPSGALIMDSTVIQKSNRPCFYVDKDNVPHITANSAEIPEGTKEAIGGAVVLVADGQKVDTWDNTTNPRTAIGIKEDNSIVIYMVDGRQVPLSVGMTYSELADTMIDLGCKWALNLDGGGSSTFATQRAGDKPDNDKNAGLSMRCSPSDGYPRTVSSSLLVVSTAQSDGVFDHAVLSPNQSVYTPGSTVKFTAQGADKSGAAVALKEGLTWKVVKGSDLGSIDQSGNFTGTENKTGTVTVGLFDGTKSVGETSVELQWPDKLGFTNSSVSLDFGETSDLSFAPTYQGREVHYKDGDFEWSVDDNSEPDYKLTYKVSVPVETYTKPGWGGYDQQLILSLTGNIGETAKSTAYYGNYLVYETCYEETSRNIAVNSSGKINVEEKLTHKGATIYSYVNGSLLKDNITSDLDETINGVVCKVTGIKATQDVNFSLGQLINNKFVADEDTSFSGRLRVNLKNNNTVSGTIDVVVGMEPYVLMDFEGGHKDPITGQTLSAEDYWTVHVGNSADNGGNSLSLNERKAYRLMMRDTTGKGVLWPKNDDGGEKNQIVSAEANSNVRFGNYAMQLAWDFGDVSTDQVAAADFGFSSMIYAHVVQPTKIGFWVNVPKELAEDTSQIKMIFVGGITEIADTSSTEKPNLENAYYDMDAEGNLTWNEHKLPKGTTQYLNYYSYDSDGNINGTQLKDWAGKGWTWIEADLSGAKFPIGIQYGYTVRVVSPQNHIKQEGTILIDNLQLIYGTNTNDINKPVIESVVEKGSNINLKDAKSAPKFTNKNLTFDIPLTDNKLTDKYATGIDSNSIRLYVDGYDYTSDAEITENLAGNSLLFHAPAMTNGEHSIKVRVKDFYGNETVETYSFTVADEEGEETLVSVIPQEEPPVIGGTFTLHVVNAGDALVDETSVTIEVPESYGKLIKDKLAEIIKYGTNYEEASSPKYDGGKITVHAKRRTSLFRKAAAAVGLNDSTEIASLTFDVPEDAKEGSVFPFSVPEANYKLGEDVGTFSMADQKIELEAAYTISASKAIVGQPVTFTVKDKAGKDVTDKVDIYEGDTVIEKQPTYDNSGRKTVYAKDSEGNRSWNLNFIVSAVGTEGNGMPYGVQNNAAPAAGHQSKQITWISAIGTSAETAKIVYAESEADLGTATPKDGTSRIVTFEESDTGVAYRLNAVTLTGLKQNTKYYYKVGDGANWSNVMTFTTTAAEKDADTEFFIFSDIQTDQTANLAAAIEKIKAAGTYDFGIQTGDAIDNVNKFSNWQGYFSNMNSENLGGVDVIHTLGNHEYYGDTAGLISGGIFGLDPTKSTQGSYYSSEYGSVYVGVINDGGSILSALEKAKQDAAKSNCSWKVLVMHQPIYGTEGVMADAQRTQVVKAIEDAGFDAVFSGDDHAYARTVPMLGDKPQKENSTDGVVYYVCGDLSGKDNAYKNQEYFAAMIPHKDYGGMYMSVKAAKESMTLTAYKYDGTLLDSYTIKKSDCELGNHTFDETSRYDMENGTLNCTLCGKEIKAENSGYTGKLQTKDETGEVILVSGKLKTGWTTLGEEIYHAGEDGLLHETETKDTATCTANGQIVSNCKTCGETYTGAATWAKGHVWDGNHVCKVCGVTGKDISRVQVQLNGEKFEYTGKAIRPAVTAYDGSYALSISSSRYGKDAYVSYENNTNTGIATVTLEGRGDYYGEVSAQFSIVPKRVEEVKAAEVFATAAILNWNPAAGAEYYIVEKKTAGGSWEKAGTTTEPNMIVSGLNPETEYAFRVFSCKDAGGKTLQAFKASEALAVTTSAGGSGDAQALAGDIYAMVTGGTTVQQLPLVTSNEKNYLLLPASADLSAVKIGLSKLTGGENVIFAGGKGKQEASGPEAVIDVTGLAAKNTAGEYEVLMTVGDASPMVLHIMKSSNVASLYLTSEDPVNAGRDFVDASKSNVAKGQMLMVNKDGSVVYSGGLKQLKARGNSTFNYHDKKSYQIKLDQSADLLNNGESVGTWVLLASYGDATLMHDKLIKDLASKMGMPYVASSDWVDLYYDGVYRGTYLLGEKNSVKDTGINITDMEAEYEAQNPNYGTDMQTATGTNKYGQSYQYTVGLKEPDDVTGGYLIERNISNIDEASGFHSRDGGGFNVKSPEYAGEEAMKYISEYYQEFEDAVYAKDENGNYTGYNKETGKYYYDYVDKDSLVKVFILQELSGNVDGFDSSCYFYKDKGEKMYAGPVWDQDMTFGTGFDQRIEADRFWYKNMAKALKEIPDFQDAVKAYYQNEFLGLAKGLVEKGGTVDTAQQQIADSAAMNYTLWPYMKIGSTAIADHQWKEGTTYNTVVSDMSSWIEKRLNKLDTMYGKGDYHTVHEYSSEIIKAATESEAGIKKYTCAICGHSYTETIPRLNPPAIGGGGAGAETDANDVVTNANMDSKKITTASLTASAKKAANGETIEAMTVSAATGKKIADLAIENKSDSVILMGDSKTKAANAQVTLPVDTVKTLAEKTDADLVVKMQNLDLRLNHQSVEALAKACKGDTITLTTATKADKPVLQMVQPDGTKALLMTVDKDGQYAIASGSTADGKITLEAKDGNTYVWMTEAEADKVLQEQIDKLEKIKTGVEATKLTLKSTLSDKGIKLTWTKSKGYKVDYYEVFRSVKRYSGYGKKAYYKTKEGAKKYYINTKEQKKGTRYFFKVRGVRVIDGQKYYTKWSNKAWRIAK